MENPAKKESAAERSTFGENAAQSGGRAKTIGHKRDILSYLAEHARITTAEAVRYLGISSDRVRQIFREMIEEGLIQRVGKHRLTCYELKKPPEGS